MDVTHNYWTYWTYGCFPRIYSLLRFCYCTKRKFHRTCRGRKFFFVSLFSLYHLSPSIQNKKKEMARNGFLVMEIRLLCRICHILIAGFSRHLSQNVFSSLFFQFSYVRYIALGFIGVGQVQKSVPFSVAFLNSFELKI